MRKKNLYFCRYEKWPNFSFRSFFFQYNQRFLFSREMGNIRKYVCKNLLNLDCWDSICFAIYEIAYK